MIPIQNKAREKNPLGVLRCHALTKIHRLPDSQAGLLAKLLSQDLLISLNDLGISYGMMDYFNLTFSFTSSPLFKLTRR